jgi:hypothetical protein
MIKHIKYHKYYNAKGAEVSPVARSGELFYPHFGFDFESLVSAR